MKRRIIDLIIIAIIIGLGLSTYVNGKVVDVNSYQARKGKVTSVVRIDGDVFTKTEKSIFYKTDCIIVEFLADEGQEIRVGDPVFRIDMNYDALAIDTEERDLLLQLEAENNQLASMGSGQQSVEWQKVQLLQEELQQAKQDLSNEESLFQAGVVTAAQLDKSKKSVTQKQITYDEAVQQYTTDVASTDLEIEKIKSSIQEIEKKMVQLQAEKSLYASVDEAGIYHSAYRGVVKKPVDVGSVIGQKTSLLDVAITGDVANYKFKGYVDASYNHLVKVGDEIDFYDGVISEPLGGRVLKVYDVVVNGKVQVDAEFLEDRSAKVGYGKTFYSEKIIEPISEKVVPKNCVIGSSDYDVDDTVEIFIIDQDLAKKIKVKIETIGDSTIGIIPLEAIELDRVIIDPSFKVKDGEKVR